MISIQTFYFSQKKKEAQTETEYWVRQLEQQFGFFFAPSLVQKKEADWSPFMWNQLLH